LPREAEATWKSFRNLTDVHVLSPGELNAYDVLVSDVVVFAKDVVPSGEGVAAKAKNAPTAKATRAETEKAAAPADAPAAEEEPSVLEDASVDSDADGTANPDDVSPFGELSALPLDDGSAPSDDYTIKGNAGSMLYHPPSSPFYGRTKAEVWFTTAEAAEAAGFQLPPSLRKSEDASAEGSDDTGEEE